MQLLIFSINALTAFLSLAPHFSIANQPVNWRVGQTVQTTSGLVEGHAAPNVTGVSEYLGIPYAWPPVGRLRFQPPVKYNGTTTINGTRFGFACIPSNVTANDDAIPKETIKTFGISENGLKILGEIIHPGLPVDEDCLTLNVWTKPQTGRKKAVLVWIHGGSFVTGSSALPFSNGQYFVDEEDIVFVSINYRFTIFGFPGDPLSNANLGLLDQRLAVEWVRDNIASFGGDPSRITLFGESAGGVSVDHYSYAWRDAPIANGLIAQSGTATGIALRTSDLARELWFNASTAVGCGGEKTPVSDVHECMMAKPAKEIVRGLINTVDSPISLPYSPTVDGKLVFANYTDITPAAIPLLIGNNDFESGLFRIFAPVFLNKTIWDESDDLLFVCPAAARAAVSLQHGNPTWRYRYFGAFPNLAISTTPPSGAYHSAELPVLFSGAVQDEIPSSVNEKTLGKYMRGAWAAFAKDPVHGLEKYDGGWPRYRANGTTLARLGYMNQPGRNFAMGNFYDLICQEI